MFHNKVQLIVLRVKFSDICGANNMSLTSQAVSSAAAEAGIGDTYSSLT